MYIFL